MYLKILGRTRAGSQYFYLSEFSVKVNFDNTDIAGFAAPAG